MTELLRTNDLVLISAIESILRAAHINCHIADQHMSAVDGSIGALPRRILVADADAARARSLLGQAGYGHTLTAS